MDSPAPPLKAPVVSAQAERTPGALALTCVLMLALAPSLAAVWFVPGFVTQDGPAHLYNAHVIAASLRPDNPFAGAYRVRWVPLPNWAGHLVLLGQLLAGVPPEAADRVAVSLTLVGLAGSVVWLRWRVSGPRGALVSAPLAVVLGLNLMWLLGFSSFLIGASLFPVTLGVWWKGRAKPGPGWALVLAILLTLGYFSHLVSLGLTVLGLGVLTLTTPGPRWWSRLGWTVAGCLPLLPLGLAYRGLTRGGGSMRPSWDHLNNPLSLASWKSQLTWIDPLTLGSKFAAPLVDRVSRTFVLLTPIWWFGLGVGLLLGVTFAGLWRERKDGSGLLHRSRRGWVVLALVLILGGLLAPDTLGRAHGYYLGQRIMLLGLVALVPCLDLEGKGICSRTAGLLLLLAWALQTAFVWDYALRADRLVRPYREAGPLVGRGQRIAGLFTHRARYRANPLMHADCLLGIGTGNVVWSNYESAYYYFPVQVRPDVPHPPVPEFEAISILSDPAELAERSRRWERLLDEHHDEIDVLTLWGDAPGLDSVNARWYEPNGTLGELSLWRRREGAGNAAQSSQARRPSR